MQAGDRAKVASSASKAFLLAALSDNQCPPASPALPPMPSTLWTQAPPVTRAITHCLWTGPGGFRSQGRDDGASAHIHRRPKRRGCAFVDVVSWMQLPPQPHGMPRGFSWGAAGHTLDSVLIGIKSKHADSNLGPQRLEPPTAN